MPESGSHGAVRGVLSNGRPFPLAGRRSALAQAVMVLSYILQQLNVQISLDRPRRVGDVAQPSGGEVERGLTVRDAPTTRVRRRISRRMRSSGLLVRIGRQCSSRKA